MARYTASIIMVWRLIQSYVHLSFSKNMFISYRRERADYGCEFFHPSSNELVLRKAVELRFQRKKERKREKGGGRKGQTREKRGTVYSYYGKRSSLGMAIRKYNKSKVIKEDYQLLEIKVGLFIIPGEIHKI